MEYNTDGFKERFEYIKMNNELNQQRSEDEERLKKAQETVHIEQRKSLQRTRVSLKKKNAVGPTNTVFNNNVIKKPE